jgi:hypothetical protein
MAERRKPKVTVAHWQNRRRGRGSWPDADAALAALSRAWTTTVFASALFVVALAVGRVWDDTIFRHALADALSGDPQQVLAVDNSPIVMPAGDELTGD